MTARDELAVKIRWASKKSTTNEQAYAAADAILAAGYRKTEPKWSETLTNDGTYEYTVSSDCDGSNVQHWRRVPGRVSIEDAMPWEAYNPEPQPTEPAPTEEREQA